MKWICDISCYNIKNKQGMLPLYFHELIILNIRLKLLPHKVSRGLQLFLTFYYIIVKNHREHRGHRE